MSKQYDTIVYIGRFQPLHNAHIATLQNASRLAKQIVIIIGSAFKPRSYKNPWTHKDREDMIRSSLGLAGMDNTCQVRIEFNPDTIYNDAAWAIRVQTLVAKHLPGKTAIIGHDKDESSFYLKMFPQWERIEQGLVEPLNATQIRDLHFRHDHNLNFLRSVVPASVQNYLEQFAKRSDFAQLVREREFIENYKKQYASLPYAPVFVTTDAVVIQSGHVVMGTRRAEPGKGLLALPGGFLNATTDKSIVEAMYRELDEETRIKVPKAAIIGNIKDSKVFDHPNRSSRGRTITHAFKIVLPDGPLPKVKGSDDMQNARWIPIGEVNSEECFEDHYEILQHFVGQ